MPLEEKPNRFQGPTFTLSAGFLVIVALLPIGVLLRDSETGAATSHGSATTQLRQRAPNKLLPACHPTDSGRLVFRKAPGGVAWSIYNAVALPYSRTAGPLVVHGEIARCYAPTPTGALLAATQISVRTARSAQWRAVIDRQVVPGPGRDAFIKAADMRTKESVESTDFGQIAGFRFTSYNQRVAVIQLGKRFFSGRMSVSTLTVKWYASDWRLEFPPDGKVNAPGRTVPSLGGYVSWRGL